MLQKVTWNNQKSMNFQINTHLFEATLENEWQCTEILKWDFKRRIKALPTFFY